MSSIGIQTHLKIFKNSICTSKKIQRFSITKRNWLMSFKQIIIVYFDIYTNTVGKVQSYWLSNQVVRSFTTGLWSVNITSVLLKMKVGSTVFRFWGTERMRRRKVSSKDNVSENFCFHALSSLPVECRSVFPLWYTNWRTLQQINREWYDRDLVHSTGERSTWRCWSSGL